jgi:hypothetical protein
LSIAELKYMLTGPKHNSIWYIQSIAELKYANRSKAQLSILYIQSLADLKYANILDAFHEFTVQKL